MNRAAMIFATVLLLVTLAGPARPAEDAPPIAAAWIDGEGEARVVVIVLYLPPSAAPISVFAGHSPGTEADGPGGYGKVKPDSWREIKLAPGEAVLARRAAPAGTSPTVLVRKQRPKKAVDVHEMIDEGGDPDPGAVLFARPRAGGPVTIDRHLARIGDRVALTVAAPDEDGFFRPETLETLRVARRLGIDSGEPDGPKGHVAVEWVRPGEEDPPARLLEGEIGENRIRSHFEQPGCQWANRHVAWMPDHFILEYLRPTTLRFTIDTAPAKAPGRVCDVWRGFGAITCESIWPNGFGGSSSNLGLPPLVLVPEGASVREVELR